VSGSGISWVVCKSAPRSRQITTPASRHSVFTGRMPFLPPNQQRQGSLTDTLFCSLAVLDPRVGHTMDVLSPFIPVLCHFDCLFHGESCPRLDTVHPGRAWPSSPACTWHCSLHYLFLQATPFTLLCEIFARACVRA